MVPLASEGISPVPPYSGSCYVATLYAYGALTRCGAPSQTLRLDATSKKQSFNPAGAVTPMVWASPRSLATTCGITVVFSSCGYLDVSVHRVGLPLAGDNTSSRCWVAPFGHLRIKDCVRLPGAFRRLPRPSSPLRAKASPVRPL